MAKDLHFPLQAALWGRMVLCSKSDRSHSEVGFFLK